MTLFLSWLSWLHVENRPTPFLFELGGEISVFLENGILILDLFGNGGTCLPCQFLQFLLMQVRQTGLDLPLSFQIVDYVTVLPTNFMGDSTNFTVLPVWAQAKLSHGDGDTQALLPIVRWRNAFVDLQTLQSVVSSFGFMGHHTTDGFPQHTAWSTEMEWTTSRVDITPFAQISEELYLVPEEMSRQLQILTADNHYLASVQNLLGNDGG